VYWSLRSRRWLVSILLLALLCVLLSTHGSHAQIIWLVGPPLLVLLWALREEAFSAHPIEVRVQSWAGKAVDFQRPPPFSIATA
jgi:hypothetical protein